MCRQDEGSAGQGYTVAEMCQLARSSLPAQRAAACRHLAALLARARPTAADAYRALFRGGAAPRPLSVPGSDQVWGCLLQMSALALPSPAPRRLQCFMLVGYGTVLSYGEFSGTACCCIPYLIISAVSYLDPRA